MTTLLQINSSLFAGNGQSSQLSDKFVAAWQDANPQGQVVRRDLSAEPVPHLTAERFGAFLAAADARTPEQQAVVDFSDRLIDELRSADVIALGLPMYNFGIPSTLKAYFDHVARAGVTFRYTANGPEGLLQNKKVYVFAARGGLYAGTPRDSQTAYVRDFLGFIGLTDVEFVYAEGLAMGDESKQKALAEAGGAIGQLVEPLRAAA
ncbi:NAD(P)H-dependent oxidoreductase [Noviherbaspirillum sp. CPCC 100848]|uniref:FMN dependent NADH:quinone oxidoreductase n=1 Tax=Noviherbaspirillum album TaxID=3080276 RepID=A0ABU6J6N8_9BURK|nr:NAD(P)H-dependent oxidoreductase [Noviherbaspirillum sp. CPCC 100848]MEC4719311.1 NAD(P)H-dependent oxidoreductase [Noviherbaspirillum sp. CPCC 100848]